MNLSFTKMQGLGNDFVLIDARERPFALNTAQLQRLADRRLGVGCDQILVIEPPQDPRARIRYRVFNADGSTAEHCGNGVRCVALYLQQAGVFAGGELMVEINGRSLPLVLEAQGLVRVDMGVPGFEPAAIPLVVTGRQSVYQVELDGTDYAFGAVSMGNPHAILRVADVAAAPVAEVGAALQNHSLFPQRVNVGFMQILDRGHIRLRVFERGAGETPACGTGACAAVAVGRLWRHLDAAVEVELVGGTLHIDWSGSPQESLWMTGPAVRVFEGNIDL